MVMRSSLQEIYAEMVGWRRHLHQHPELSFEEYETTQFVFHLLTEWGIEAKVGSTGCGVIATINGHFPGPMIALRADLDALPIQDEKNVTFASQIKGKMHACGHDAHTAALLGTAKLLQQHRETLKGSIRLIFQHAEEICPGGALDMIADGALEGVDVIYGMHLWTPLPFGTIGTNAGPMMAAADEFTIEIRGKGGHGGVPHEAIDSIVVGAQLVNALQTIVSRTVNPIETCVLSIGSFHGGVSFNSIADTATLTGTVRTFDEQVRTDVKQRILQIAEHTATMHGATIDVQYISGYPPLVNDETETARFFKVAETLSKPGQTQLLQPIMASEDFAYYLQKVPGCFMFVGAGQTSDETSYPHHHPLFTIEEEAMITCVQLFLNMVESYQGEHIGFINV